MCAHFGVVRCVLCVSQRFGHRALTVACGKPGPDGRHWPGDGFMTKRSSGRCPEARPGRRMDAGRCLRSLRGGAQRRRVGRVVGCSAGLRTGKNPSIWVVRPPKSADRRAGSAPTRSAPHRHARHAVTCENFPDEPRPAARKCARPRRGGSAVLPLSAQNP